MRNVRLVEVTQKELGDGSPCPTCQATLGPAATSEPAAPVLLCSQCSKYRYIQITPNVAAVLVSELRVPVPCQVHTGGSLPTVAGFDLQLCVWERQRTELPLLWGALFTEINTNPLKLMYKFKYISNYLKWSEVHSFLRRSTPLNQKIRKSMESLEEALILRVRKWNQEEWSLSFLNAILWHHGSSKHRLFFIKPIFKRGKIYLMPNCKYGWMIVCNHN